MNAPTPADSVLRWPAPDETRAPYRVYADSALYEHEQERIFRGPVWSFLGLATEVPNAGDFKSTFIGDTPVVLTRDAEGVLHCWVNRCAHRGALVCRELRGNVGEQGTHTCVYHQWAYDATGALVGVPFRRGLGGKGGYPADFDMAAHGLQRLNVDSVGDMVFGTFDPAAPPLREFLGAEHCANIERLFSRPITILGHARQYFPGNWKLYAENSRDSYHGGLLHLFYPTFGIYRQGQRGWVHLSDNKLHQLLQVCKPAEDQSIEHYQQASSRKADSQAQLEAPEMLRWEPELGGEIALTIHSMFPNVVLQQISNTLAVRQIQTKGVDATELVWTFYGFTDDSPELTAHRLKQFNMVGPAGYISMEDGEAVSICQQGIAGGLDQASVIECGGNSIDSIEVMGVDENGVRGFWHGYRKLMGL
ncbi:Rieske 2Fe-2S domain-containing protein [Immundisolibacter sp.]|uniref:Rieske 2Fe-2S domain-containing protein n=1 Tax=Immundisolibacter sp. TaxID=1934948 RepID=UPI003F831B2D